MLSCPFDALDRIAACLLLATSALLVLLFVLAGRWVLDSAFMRWLKRRG